MDIYWYGQACFKIKGKNTTVAIDPFNPDFTGLKLPKDMEADVVLSTHNHNDHNNLDAVSGNPVKINGPGDYEVKGISISGIQVYHDKNLGSERGKNTVYNILIDGLNIVHLGDLGHKFNDDQISAIGETDVLMIPTGGVYTIDSKEAVEVVAQLEPKIIIPMHYKINDLKFELDDIDSFLEEMGAENIESINKLTITKDKLPDEPKVVVLSKV